MPPLRPLSKKERKRLLQQQLTAQITTEFYAGALPHPQHLERFEALYPGTTERLITMAEAQGIHRQAMEKKFLNFNGFSQVAGTLFAGIVAVMAVGGGIYLLAKGQSLLTFAACLTPLAPIIWAFRRERDSQKIQIAAKK